MVEKNIVWVVLDSIRGDRTPFGGHTRQTMPNLSKLATNSNAVGTTCISHGIWSQPSMASMMTGTWPSHHGTGLHNQVLPEEIPTVAERLSNASYHTIGLSTNPYFSPATGLDRGFDEFKYMSIKDLIKESGLASTLSFIRQIRRYSAGITLEKRKHTPDYLFNEIIKNKLTEMANNDQSFALFAHYHGVHHPYYPSPKFRGIFQDDTTLSANKTAEVAYQSTTDPYDTIANSKNISDDEWTAIQTAYDSLIRQLDNLISSLIAHVDHLGLDENTIFILTSDHGDLLGEFGLVSHKLLLHDALIQVPIIVRGSDQLMSIDEHLIQHIDVLQTILDEVGVPTEGMHGITLPDDSRKFTITQRGSETAEKTLKHIREENSGFTHNLVQSGLVTALRTEDWKLITNGENTDLFHLPNEYNDVSSDYPEYSKELSQKLDNWMEQFGAPIDSNTRAMFSEEVQQQLTNLGYIVDE